MCQPSWFGLWAVTSCNFYLLAAIEDRFLAPVFYQVAGRRMIETAVAMAQSPAGFIVVHTKVSAGNPGS